MEEVNLTSKELKAIVGEYTYTGGTDIMCEDSQKVRVAKLAVGMLDEADRIIWCLAMDQESSRKVGKILGVSHSTVLKQLTRIKAEIINNVMHVLETEDLED